MSKTAAGSHGQCFSDRGWRIIHAAVWHVCDQGDPWAARRNPRGNKSGNWTKATFRANPPSRVSAECDACKPVFRAASFRFRRSDRKTAVARRGAGHEGERFGRRPLTAEILIGGLL